MKSRRGDDAGASESEGRLSDTAGYEVKVHAKANRMPFFFHDRGARMPLAGPLRRGRTPPLASPRAACALPGRPLAYGPDAATARASADAVASAMEAPIHERACGHPSSRYARLRIARYALAPSKLVKTRPVDRQAHVALGGAERDLDSRAAS